MGSRLAKQDFKWEGDRSCANAVAGMDMAGRGSHRLVVWVCFSTAEDRDGKITLRSEIIIWGKVRNQRYKAQPGLLCCSQGSPALRVHPALLGWGWVCTNETLIQNLPFEGVYTVYKYLRKNLSGCDIQNQL